MFCLIEKHIDDKSKIIGSNIINAKKSVLDGIGHVAGIVDNDDLIVHQECKESLSSLDQYQWDPNPNLMKEKPKHNMASHMADAMRYALYTFETSITTF